MNDAIGEPPTRRLQSLMRSPWLVMAIVVVPLALAAVLLARRPWAPVLDMAMTELRLRDVGGHHTPLIGLPGRIGDFPNQGSHPGPASFYLLSPFYRLAGATAYGMELGSIVINSVTIGLIVWLGHRRAGIKGAIVFGAITAIAVRGYGLTVLTHPWNPYFPVLLWLLVLVAAWSALLGDNWMALIVVVAGSIAAQTHVPYLLNAIAICALVLGTMTWRLRDRDGRRGLTGPLIVSVGVGVLVWVPAFIDQLIRDPGNIRMLVRHFASDPPEPAIGLADGVRVFFRHLDVPSAFVDLFLHGDSFVYRSGLPRGNGLLGVVVFALWIVAAVIAHRHRHLRLMMLNRVLAVALAAGALSMVRIFGKVWYYLTLWAWGTMLLVVLSITWTVWWRWREHHAIESSGTRHIVIAGGAAIVVCTAMSIGAAIVLEVPEQQLSDGLRVVVPPTEAALRAGVGPAVGPDGRYLVFWQDSVFIGAQGYGLVNELERDGFDVGVHETWRVPVTPQRVFPQGTYDAEVHLVSGEYIDQWRANPNYVEVATEDVRTPAERERFDELRNRVHARLTEIGRGDLLQKVDENLFGASLEPDLPDDVLDDMSEMLLLAEPVSVFLAPPGSTF